MTSISHPNRAARRAAGVRGAHRRQSDGTQFGFRRAGVAAAMFMVTTGLVAGVAYADPQINPVPGGNNPSAPSTVNPAAPPVPQAPPSNQGQGAIPDPPSTQWRPNPWTPNAPSISPITYPGTQSPTPLDTIFRKPAPPMILPEPGVIRVGKYQTVKPTWITMAEMNSINRWSAYIESRVAQYWLSQGFSQKEADRRAASMMVGGVVGGAAGGAAGFAIGVVPGAIIGAPLGAAVGAGIGAAGAAAAVGAGLIPLNFLIPGVGSGIWANAVGAAALGGAAAGAAVGIPLGAAVGGAIGGTIVGVPGAILGVGLGSVFGGGDPNQKIDQPWLYRNGKGQITPKKNKLEFDWEGNKSVPALAGLNDAHINLQVKDDDTWVVKLGDERWLGATQKQRDKYFYGEIDQRAQELLPIAGKDFKPGQQLRTVMEDENGVFQTTIRDFLSHVAKEDSKNTQYNPDGDIADTDRRAERVHYGYTSTPDQWDEPRYKDGENPRAEGGSEDAGVTGNQPPTTDDGQAAPGPVQAPVPEAPKQESIPVAASIPAVATLQAPVEQAAPVVKTGNKAVDQAAAGVQNEIAKFIPGVPAA